MKIYNDDLIQGAYTIAFSGDKAILIGDESPAALFDNMTELVEFLSEEGCTGIYKQDGVYKAKFYKDIEN